MCFDLKEALERVADEYDALVDEIWPMIEKSCSSVERRSLPKSKERRRNEAYQYFGRLFSDPLEEKADVLWELMSRCHWHATDCWQKLRPHLTYEEAQFYVQTMLALAQESFAKDGKFGASWIVEKYDDGLLREFISEEMLFEAVNCGFWEYAHTYFCTSNPCGRVMNREGYFILAKYFNLLDLTRIEEFRDLCKPLYDCFSWTEDKAFLDAFERVRPKLTEEQAGWFARAIIDGFISRLSSYDYTEEISPREAFKEQIEPYADLISTEAVQSLLREHIAFCAKHLDNDEDEMWDPDDQLKTLLDFLSATLEEKKELISANLDRDDEKLGRILVNLAFPPFLLTKEAVEFVQGRIIEAIQAPPQKCVCNSKKEVIPNLCLIQSAQRQGWLEDGWAKKHIEAGLAEYLKGKSPSGEAVNNLLSDLDRDLVSAELYQKVLERGVADLVLRKKVQKAEQWRKVLKGQKP